MVHFAPTTITIDAPGVAKLFYDTIVRIHGQPYAIVSDSDPKFTSKFWQTLHKLTGTRLAMSSSCHPQTDGQTEVANQILEKYLRAYVNDQHNDWHEHLTAAEIAYNNTVNKATGFSPFYLNYGFHPRTPATMLAAQESTSSVPNATHFVETLHDNLTKAVAHLGKAQAQQVTYPDRRRIHVEFEVGDKVLLSTQNLNTTSGTQVPKLAPKFVGPFDIVAKISPVSYKLHLPAGMKMHPVFHVSLLKPFLGNDDHEFPDRVTSTPPGPVFVDKAGVEYFEVEKILDDKIEVVRGRPVKKWLVKWLGYPESDNSWEPRNIFARNALKDMLADYEATH